MSIIDKVFYIAKEKIQKAFIIIKDAITKFFSKALEMMKMVMNKLVNRVRGVILGATHFFRKVGSKYQEGTRNYSLEEEIGEWHETTVTRDVPLEDVPPKYRTNQEEFEVDDTREMDAVLVY